MPDHVLTYEPVQPPVTVAGDIRYDSVPGRRLGVAMQGQYWEKLHVS